MSVERMDAALLRRVMPPRRSDTHKGDYGRAHLVCGAVGLSGAAIFAAAAAVRSGAGLVSMTVPAKIWPLVAPSVPEVMVTPAGADSAAYITQDMLPDITQQCTGADAVLIGCGLGRKEDTLHAVRAAMEEIACPLVLDADGINAFAGHIHKLTDKGSTYVLTPHDGELTRLLGEMPQQPGESRTDCARRLAARLGAILVLKGPASIVADPDGRCCVNTTGNPGMARGGSGDVLAGVITALLAQHIDPFDAVCAAVFIHGLAGDLAAARRGETGMTPLDMLAALPDAFLRTIGK